MKELITNNTEVRMTSKELCDLINAFRKEEGNETEKRHDVLMRDIRTELEALANAGIEDAHNFVEVEYTDKKGEKRPCFLLTKQSAMQFLNKESAVVRHKTQEYITALEEELKANSLPIPQGPQLIGVNPYHNRLIKKNINQLDTADIPRYVNNLLELTKSYTPSARLNAYQLTRGALENLLPTLLDSFDQSMVRASLDKLNKLIEKQKTYIYASKLGQATKKNNKLEEIIRQLKLDSYDNYYMVGVHGFTVNCSYCASDNKIKCTKAYKDWKSRADVEMQGLPTFEELGLDPLRPKKLDAFFYLKDKTFDVSNCTKSFLDALQAHYQKEYPNFNDNVFADVRVRKYFSYSGSYENGCIVFGIKDLTDEEIEELTFDDEIE